MKRFQYQAPEYGIRLVGAEIDDCLFAGTEESCRFEAWSVYGHIQPPPRLVKFLDGKDCGPAFEPLQSFIARVERRTGLPIHRIPDGKDESMLEGSPIISGPYGILVYLDCCGQDEETGVDLYARCVLIRREQLPAADEDADGVFQQ